MALFRNLGVKLRSCLCDVPRYASAQPLVFLDLAKNCSFLNWKLTLMPIQFLRFVVGHYLVVEEMGRKNGNQTGLFIDGDKLWQLKRA